MFERLDKIFTFRCFIIHVWNYCTTTTSALRIIYLLLFESFDWTISGSQHSTSHYEENETKLLDPSLGI